MGIGSSNKADKHNVAAQLSKYACDIASFSARLNKNGPAALNLRGLEILDLKNAIDSEIWANDKEHLRDFTSSAIGRRAKHPGRCESPDRLFPNEFPYK